MIFDTDILVWLFRGNPKAAKEISRAAERMISAVSVMELYQGARSRSELQSINRFFQHHGFVVLPLLEPIGDAAIGLIEEYSASHGLQLADALIAATARHFRAPLATGNVKHFRSIPRLQLHAFRPLPA